MTKLTALLKSPAARFLGMFGLILIALFTLLASPEVERGFTQPFTAGLVDAAHLLIAPFDGRVIADGDILRFNDGLGAVQVLAGCNAVEVCALLIAAILAFPGPLRNGLIGAAAGVAALQTVNLLRIISLLYLSRGSQEVFDFFHHYVWDAMIGLEGLLIFFFWVRWQDGQAAKAAAKAEAAA